MTEETLLKFPCEFSVKAMGRSHADLMTAVKDIMQRHVTDLSAQAFAETASSAGKFVSITVTITATSKQQLDAIYQDLSAHELVLMAL